MYNVVLLKCTLCILEGHDMRTQQPTLEGLILTDVHTGLCVGKTKVHVTAQSNISTFVIPTLKSCRLGQECMNEITNNTLATRHQNVRKTANTRLVSTENYR